MLHRFYWFIFRQRNILLRAQAQDYSGHCIRKVIIIAMTFKKSFMSRLWFVFLLHKSDVLQKNSHGIWVHFGVSTTVSACTGLFLRSGQKHPVTRYKKSFVLLVLLLTRLERESLLIPIRIGSSWTWISVCSAPFNVCPGHAVSPLPWATYGTYRPLILQEVMVNDLQ